MVLLQGVQGCFSQLSESSLFKTAEASARALVHYVPPLHDVVESHDPFESKTTNERARTEKSTAQSGGTGDWGGRLSGCGPVRMRASLTPRCFRMHAMEGPSFTASQAGSKAVQGCRKLARRRTYGCNVASKLNHWVDNLTERIKQYD